ncbi:viral A-type inclusion protein [Reticulomyxa filosa]|uniref:Viral A-type inclusion protein n=1 Tax=Reticulomyxa filosa TaxID=46433 RepID=X6MW78_RETFI|nr:viral A-type inclusion protein [Reticulomyxa filosa]|eukprot:ETO18089.1 viral A-type inclusion protein [Reticulomyxa filosa]
MATEDIVANRERELNEIQNELQNIKQGLEKKIDILCASTQITCPYNEAKNSHLNLNTNGLQFMTSVNGAELIKLMWNDVFKHIKQVLVFNCMNFHQKFLQSSSLVEKLEAKCTLWEQYFQEAQAKLIECERQKSQLLFLNQNMEQDLKSLMHKEMMQTQQIKNLQETLSTIQHNNENLQLQFDDLKTNYDIQDDAIKSLNSSLFLHEKTNTNMYSTIHGKSDANKLLEKQNNAKDKKILQLMQQNSKLRVQYEHQVNELINKAANLTIQVDQLTVKNNTLNDVLKVTSPHTKDSKNAANYKYVFVRKVSFHKKSEAFKEFLKNLFVPMAQAVTTTEEFLIGGKWIKTEKNEATYTKTMISGEAAELVVGSKAVDLRKCKKHVWELKIQTEQFGPSSKTEENEKQEASMTIIITDKFDAKTSKQQCTKTFVGQNSPYYLAWVGNSGYLYWYDQIYFKKNLKI